MGKLNCKICITMGKQNASGVNVSVEGLSIGLNKGFATTKITRRRPSQRRSGMNARIENIVKTVKTVAGFAPYEKRSIEMYKVGNTKLDKRANRFLKKRLGSLRRSKKKSEDLQLYVKKLKEKRQN